MKKSLESVPHSVPPVGDGRVVQGPENAELRREFDNLQREKDLRHDTFADISDLQNRVVRLEKRVGLRK